MYVREFVVMGLERRLGGITLSCITFRLQCFRFLCMRFDHMLLCHLLTFVDLWNPTL